jgi:cytidylate kinase
MTALLTSTSFVIIFVKVDGLTFFILLSVPYKKRLKMPKGSESVNLRRTDTTMTKKKGRTEKQRFRNLIYILIDSLVIIYFIIGWKENQ